MPTKEEIKEAMDVLKAAGMKFETKMLHGDPTSIVFVIHVPLTEIEDL